VIGREARGIGVRALRGRGVGNREVAGGVRRGLPHLDRVPPARLRLMVTVLPATLPLSTLSAPEMLMGVPSCACWRLFMASVGWGSSGEVMMRTW
jgi:hypothetical protein